MQAFLEQETRVCRERLTAKQTVLGPIGGPPTIDPAFGGAVTDLCHVLLNLNEFVYLD